MSPVGGAGFEVCAVSALDENDAEPALVVTVQARRHKKVTIGTNGLRNADFIAGHPQQPWRLTSLYGKPAINE